MLNFIHRIINMIKREFRTDSFNYSPTNTQTKFRTKKRTESEEITDKRQPEFAPDNGYRRRCTDIHD